MLKKGSASDNWGWKHIVDRDHHNQIKEAFKLADNDKTVKDCIAEGLEKGHMNPNDPIEIIWDTANPDYKLLIILSDLLPGSLTTAYPIPK